MVWRGEPGRHRQADFPCGEMVGSGPERLHPLPQRGARRRDGAARPARTGFPRRAARIHAGGLEPGDDLRRVPPASTTLPVAAELDALVREIAAATNPVIVTEFAGREPGAFEALVDFAEAGAIPVIGGRTAFYGNFPTDHDLWQGVETYAHLEDADLVLLVGARTPWYRADRPPDGRADRLHRRPSHKEWLVYQVMHADAYLEGDIAATLAALAALLRERGPADEVRRARRDRWAAEHAALTAKLRADREASAGGALDTLPVCRALERAMPADTVYVDETITHFLTMRHHLPLTRARSLYKLTVSGLGQGLGLALGMKLGAPERPVVAVVGDGSFLYNPIPQAFGASRDYGLPIIVLIMNNRGYQAMLNGQRLYYADAMARRTELTLGLPDRPAGLRGDGRAVRHRRHPRGDRERARGGARTGAERNRGGPQLHRQRGACRSRRAFRYGRSGIGRAADRSREYEQTAAL